MGYYGWEEDVEDYVTQSQYVSVEDRYKPIRGYMDDLIIELYNPLEGKMCPHLLHYLLNKIAGELDLEIPTDNIPQIARTA